MQALLKFSGFVDRCNEWIGKAARWVVLIVVLVSTMNAMMRYIFNYSSNAFLEIQWYLFGLIFLSCAGYTLLRNEHVRIDIVLNRFSKRGQAWIDIFGILVFLLPMAVAVLWLSWPVFVDSFLSNEMSNSPGGLIVWPARFMLPAGFLLLILQGISELIKRIGFLKGLCPNPTEKFQKANAEDDLVEAIKANREKGK